MTDPQPTDEKVKEGVEHLQNAALELIAAARIFLDVAEEVVRDPAPFLARARHQAASSAQAGGGGDDTVQRIRVV